MSLEIERKWIIDQDLPANWEVLIEESVWTAYLVDDPELRLRKRGERETVLSLKWPVDESGLIREEFETRITREDFDRMTMDRELLRREDRHVRLPTGEVLEISYIPEIGRTYGEIEFDSEEAAVAFIPPFDWGREVTGRVKDSFRSIYDTWLRGAFDGLYYSEPEILFSEVEVIEIRENKVRIDRQIFYPEGGGQPGDQGTLGPWRVEDTLFIDDIVWLILEEDAKVKVGECYQAIIDGARRLRFRQQHTAEHLLSGLGHKYFGVNNTGFHMNEELFTLDFDRRLEEDDISRLEQLANEGIRTNARVKTHYGTAKDFEDVEYRAKMDFTGPLRLVEIEGFDLCACTSLHVQQTGELGILQIIQEKAVRGGSRLTVLVGEEALKDLKARADMSEALAREKSCHYTDLMDRLQKDEAEITLLKQKVLTLGKTYVEHRLAEINHLDQPIVIFITGDEDEVMLIHDLLIDKSTPNHFLLLRFIDRDTYSFKLFATDVKPHYQKLCERFEIRGGIRDSLAQGRLIADEEPFEVLRELGYKQQIAIRFH